MEKIKVAAVSYLNTKPFLFGLEHSIIKSQLDISIHNPAVVGQMLMSGKAQIGLVPVATLLHLSGAEIITNYCIGCNGEAASVCIYSQIPIEEVRQIYLDYQSQTSVALIKLLFNHFWKLFPTFLESHPGYENDIVGSRAGLVIGDRSLQMKNRFSFCYDLGDYWKRWTGNSFVFACWVQNRKHESSFIESFDEALKFGIDKIENVIAINQPLYPGIDVRDYLTRKMQFHFDSEKRVALDQFLQVLKEAKADM